MQEIKNEQQLRAIKDENVKVVKKINYKKPKLTSLRFLINTKDKGQGQYFNDLVKLEESIDYKDLYYQSGNKRKDTFDFGKYGQWLTYFKELILKK